MEQSTIRVTVRLSGHLRRFGGANTALSLPREATVRQALQSLAESSAELRAALLNASGDPSTQILIFVDDEQTHATHVLADGARLTLMLPISGG